jgi:hypothetical protein
MESIAADQEVAIVKLGWRRLGIQNEGFKNRSHPAPCLFEMIDISYTFVKTVSTPTFNNINVINRAITFFGSPRSPQRVLRYRFFQTIKSVFDHNHGLTIILIILEDLF